MAMHDKLIQQIQQTIAISLQEIELCKKYFEPVSYPKNIVIEGDGRRPNYLYYVVNGYVRLFYHDLEGQEITTHINCPPGFITSYKAFIDRAETNDNVGSLTDCDLLRISKPDLDMLLQQSSNFNTFSISVFQQALAYNETRANELATLTAEQRYKKLIHNFPDILHNVPVQHIASFLGMKPESLSRIRRKIIS